MSLFVFFLVIHEIVIVAHEQFRIFDGRMIDLFIEFVSGKVQEADEALGRGDLPAVARAAHAIKSSAANVGAVRVQRVATDIEQHIREAAADQAAGAVEELNAAVQ